MYNKSCVNDCPCTVEEHETYKVYIPAPPSLELINESWNPAPTPIFEDSSAILVSIRAY